MLNFWFRSSQWVRARMRRLPKLYASLRRAGLLSLTLSLCMASCTSEVDDYYSRYPARFAFNAVLTMAPLNRALNNEGMFCSISRGRNKNYVFRGNDGLCDSVYQTAIDANAVPVCINGFIVGLPSELNMKGMLERVAYDLVCPNCYGEFSINRALSFRNRTEAVCSRCKCVYSLNTGNLLSGESSVRRLERYQIVYSDNSNVVIVQNN